jgi:tetratricopeptide (TPR) repeat protein
VTRTWLIVIGAVAVGALAAAAMRPRPSAAAAAALPRVQGTLPGDLDAALRVAEQRLAANNADAVAAVRAAEVLLRKARVERNGGYAVKAERILDAILDEEPGEYSALKMLGAVYASQHRFDEAIAVARRATAINPRDAWNYGTLGDSYLELGDWDRAFDAFDAMVRMRPDAASYARVAYAHELQGDLPEALRLMRMATEATSPHDVESLAWHHAQLGHLHLKMGDAESAQREFAHAEFFFRGYPDARDGMERIRVLRDTAREAPRPASGSGTRSRAPAPSPAARAGR